MKYDSVLDQQSISGKIVSLILCVWKPCYVKSSHICQLINNIKLATYKGKQLKWRCHNDATIPKVELWFQLLHCYADFEVVYSFELMTQPLGNCRGAENR